MKLNQMEARTIYDFVDRQLADESSHDTMSTSRGFLPSPPYPDDQNWEHRRRKMIKPENLLENIYPNAKSHQNSVDSQESRIFYPKRQQQHEISPNNIIRLKYRSPSILLAPLLVLLNLLHSSWHILCQFVMRLGKRRCEQYNSSRRTHKQQQQQTDFCINGSYDSSKCSSLFPRIELLQAFFSLLWTRVRCQISFVKSDFISIIALILCLLSPVVTPAVASNNAVLPSSQGADLSQSIDGVVGKTVEMPCGITPSRRDDAVYMVLWFRGDESIPIYSLDVRGKPFSGAKHWTADVPFGKRAHFRTVSEPAKLVVEGIRVPDQGIYRCRVDFRNSPSRETRLNLTVVVPPDEPLIYENMGLSSRGEVGPFREGSTLELTCIVRGGNPSPRVHWYLNDELVDSSYHIENDREVINHISVPNIQRSHHRSRLACRAFNTLLSPPISKTVTIELNLRPLTVSLLHHHTQLSTDMQYEIICESWGSHPAPQITFWLDSQELKGGKVEDARSSNTSVSRLSLIPAASLDGQRLTCRSENPLLPASAIEDSWRLKVVYSPVLTLRMGSSLNPKDIKEGDDVYFECSIKSNPPIQKLLWYHNGAILHHNQSAGVILSNQSLVLQRVSRPSRGNYSCRAVNQQGIGYSNEVLLEIMYAPTCQANLSGTEGGSGAIIIAASRLEDVRINCEMDALPDNLKFHWTHTNTVGESSELPSEIYSNHGSRSLLSYHVKSENDFGTLLCFASNSIGTAERPCIYQIVVADVPQPVENCSIVNRTSTSVELTCEPGFDGGLPQLFILEAFQSAPSFRRGLQFNISSKTSPTFSLTDLDTEGTFHFKIYAVNRKGRSSPTIMDGIALHYPAMQSAKIRDLEKTTIALIIGSGAAFAVAFFSLIAFLLYRRLHPINSSANTEMNKSFSHEFRHSRRSSTHDELYHNHHSVGNNKKHHHDGGGGFGGDGSSMENPFTQTNIVGNMFNEDDGDPDLIPSKNAIPRIGTGKSFSRMSNGEITQLRYGSSTPPLNVVEKIPLRSGGPPDLPLTTMEAQQQMPCTMSNYTAAAAYRGGKPNGLPIKHHQLETRQNVEVGTYGTTLHGQPTTMVVNIDSRVLGQQLASNQLPESCV